MITKVQLIVNHPILSHPLIVKLLVLSLLHHYLKNKKVTTKKKGVSFKAKRIEGSINLYGATIDEVILSDYFETIKKEKKIRLCKRKLKVSLFFENGVGLNR